MKLETVATRPVAILNPGDPLDTAVQRMWRGRCVHLPVVDGGRLIGIVSERDLLIHAHGDGYAAHELAHIDIKHVLGTSRVDDVMTSPVLTLAPSDSIKSAARLMLEHGIHAIPLAKHESLFGIVTETDLLKCFLQDDPLVLSKQIRNAKVTDYMVSHVFSVTKDSLKPAVVRLMRDKKIRHVPVVDEGGRLIGIVSESDVLLGCKIDRSNSGLTLHDLAVCHQSSEVAELMSSNPLVIDMAGKLSDVVASMVAKKIGCLPVVEGDKLVGIVTSTDLVQLLLHEL